MNNKNPGGHERALLAHLWDLAGSRKTLEQRPIRFRGGEEKPGADGNRRFWVACPGIGCHPRRVLSEQAGLSVAERFQWLSGLVARGFTHAGLAEADG